MPTPASKFRRWGLLTLAFSALCPANGFESLDRLESAARGFAQQQLAVPGNRQRLQVGPLDGRLRLPRCGAALSARRGPGATLQDRTLVEVSCAAPAWRTFVPVRLVGLASAVALARPKMAGDRLALADLKLIEGDAAQFPLGYFTDPEALVGTTLKRALGGGVILSNQLLQSADGIVRGQAVTLVAEADGVAVRMNGRALSDGAVNQRIKVRNESSGKVLEGIARSARLVQVNP